MIQKNPHSVFLEHLGEKIGLYRSILCLNGTLPDALFFQSLSLPLFAVDGAANTLVEQGIFPELILGDLDSVSASICKEHPTLHLPDQNSSDFEKAMEFLGKRNLLPAIVLGMNGGYIDHILNNMNVFMTDVSQSIFYDPPIVGYGIHAPSVCHLSLAEETKLSLIPMPTAAVTTSGLKWNLDRQTLTFPGQNSCFNRTQDKEISIRVHEGALVVCIYLYPIHDAGMNRFES